MNRRETVLFTLHQYKELQEKFIGLCTVFVEALPSGNEFGVEVGSGDDVSRNISVLGHPCKLLFSIRMEPHRTIGKLTFQRLFPQERTSDLLTVYFDRLGNATETLEDGWSYSITKSTDVTNWLLIRVLETFFKSLATPIEAQT
jgi:hypothetical protein